MTRQAATWNVEPALLAMIVPFVRATKQGVMVSEKFIVSSVKEGNVAVYSLATVSVDSRQGLSVVLKTATASTIVPKVHTKLLSHFAKSRRMHSSKHWVEQQLVERGINDHEVLEIKVSVRLRCLCVCVCICVSVLLVWSGFILAAMEDLRTHALLLQPRLAIQRSLSEGVRT